MTRNYETQGSGFRFRAFGHELQGRAKGPAESAATDTQTDHAAADFIARRCERMQNGHMHDC